MPLTSQSPRRTLLAAGIVALLLALLTGVVWWFGRDTGVLRAKANACAEEFIPPVPSRPERPKVTPPDFKPVVVETPPDIRPTPPEDPDKDKTPVIALAFELPPLNRFRRLVYEADHALKLPKLEDGHNEELEHVHRALGAIKSDYASFSARKLEGPLTGTEMQSLDDGLKRDFLDPDVDSKSFAVRPGARVQLWVRDGAKLPARESDRFMERSVPYHRRPQEDVSTSLLAVHLEAVESEFGLSDFGRNGVLPMDIVIHGDQERYIEFAAKRLGVQAPRWSVGLYAPRWDLICVPLRADVSLAEVLRHEMFHAYQSRVAPSSLASPWFSEGTAEWLDKAPPKNNRPATNETFRDAACGHLLSQLDGGMKFELEKYLKLSLSEFYIQPEINYLVAYCFVDFLRNTPDYTSVYHDFWKCMRDHQEDHLKALDKTFGLRDLAAMQQRFIKYLRRFKPRTAPVRFLHDVPASDDPLVLPETSARRYWQPTHDVGVSKDWYEVMGRLADAGIYYEGPALHAAQYDHIVIVIDSSVSMASGRVWRGNQESMFLDWATALELAPRLKLTRGNLPEVAPLSVLVMLVQAVLENRQAKFSEISGIAVDAKLTADIKAERRTMEKTFTRLHTQSMRNICEWVAMKLAQIWSAFDARVSIVDFNHRAKTAVSAGGAAAIPELFNATADNASTSIMAGADTDWLLAMTKALRPDWHGPAARTAVLFFTDGPNSTGTWGHSEFNRNDKRYFEDLELVAREIADHFKASNLVADQCLFQFMALWGAENQGLEVLAAALPGSRVDDWPARFGR